MASKSSSPPKPAPGIFARYGLTPLINASGTETGKGASPVCAEVLNAVNALVPHCVDMLELQSAAARTIARVFGAESGLVAHCSAAGIAVAVAACMTGEDLARIEQLPDTTGLRNEVVLQRGHNINYGARIAQNIALTGARVVEIGAATACGSHHLASALRAETAAALFVVSHHTVPSGLIDLATFCQVCRARGVPVIVDAAAEPDPRPFLRAGAHLVITSLHKQFSSLTGATIAGRLDLVRACFHQEKGIGRPMKAGKECVIGAIAALERWAAADHSAFAVQLEGRLHRCQRRLAGLPGLTVSIELDATSRQFSRLLLRIDPARAGLDAFGVASALAAERPAIIVRSLLADVGLLQIDLRRASDEGADHIADRLAAILTTRRKTRRARAKPAPAANSADRTRARLGAFPLREKQP